MVTQGMGYEVDYLPVGEGEKSGDAIASRWGYLGGGRADQRVIVIDGGTKESGLALVERIDSCYQTDKVDLMICTHCDADHASGLSVVIRELQVGALLMHTPWQYAENIHKIVTDGRVTEQSLTRRIKGGLETAHELWELARSKRVRIIEPFSGLKYAGPPELIVLGPDRSWYKQLLSKFRCVPQTDPTPDFSPSTSAENQLEHDHIPHICGRKMMFTGDAGVEALTRAITYGEKRGLEFANLHLFHVPHHGSKHNVDPQVLARFRSRIAVISAAPNGAPKHPSSNVTNALIDYRTTVFSTQGQAFCHSVNAPDRPGWSPATPVPYNKSLSALESLAWMAA